METIDDLFRAFGGPAAIGRIIGKRTEHATGMKRRNSIPVRYWQALIESDRGRELGLTYAKLVELHVRENGNLAGQYSDVDGSGSIAEVRP